MNGVGHARVLLLASLLVLGLACRSGQQVDGDVLWSNELTPSDAGCTPRSEANNFPVKVLLLVENGGSLCVVDPPGAQGVAGFCAALGLDAGVSVPGRISAAVRFVSANANRPNLQVAVLPFSFGPTSATFAPASQGTASAQLSALPGQLGAGDDLQGALESARDVLARDMAATAPAVRARSRYAVVVLSTGLPFPRCAANDTRTVWATQTSPDGVWADQTALCNVGCVDDAGCPPNFEAGGDRNQIAQLLDLVDQLMSLKTSQGLGDLRVHARLVLDEAELVYCGALCGDLFAPVSIPYARDVGAYTLQLLAQRGQGTWEAPLSPQDLSLSSVDTTEFTQLCPQ